MNIKEQLKKADILGLAIIAAAVISYSIQSVWGPYQWIALVLGGAIIIASLAVKAGEIRAGLGRRSSRFGINSAASVVFFIGVLAALNYLGAQHAKRVDMTTEKINSLVEQSAAVAQQVKEDLKIKAFYPGGEYVPIKELLELYKAQNNKISYEFVDPDKQPQITETYKVTQYGEFQNPMTGETFRSGTVILEMAGKMERIEKQTGSIVEEDVTNALMKIVKGEKKTIYFTEGHGEKRIDNAERDGYQAAAKRLEQENYVVKSLNLADGRIPQDATVVVIAGATTQPLAEQVEYIDAYLKAGGSVWLMLDPSPAPSFAEFLKPWSIEVGNDYVSDPTRFVRESGPSAPVPFSYGTHRIMERFRLLTFYPYVRSVSPVMPAAEGITVEPLINTSPNSWSETGPRSEPPKFDEKADAKGPRTLGVVATKSIDDTKKSRLVVFGDSDFATNTFFASEGNGNLFLNTVAWLAQDEAFISIRPKDSADRRLTMTDAQGRLVTSVLLLFLPGGVLVAGISVWLKRRK